MKTIKLIFAALALFIANTLTAQVSINVNIGSPPLWGPVGYTEARYYYLPDVEAYYDIQSCKFIYLGNGKWIHRSHLPFQHRAYDLYSGYKVVLTDDYGDNPYDHFKEHKHKYVKGYREHEQKTIGERPGKKHDKARSEPKAERTDQKGESHTPNHHNSGKHHNDHGGKSKRK